MFLSNCLKILTLGSFLNSLMQDPRVWIYMGEETYYLAHIAAWLSYMVTSISLLEQCSEGNRRKGQGLRGRWQGKWRNRASCQASPECPQNGLMMLGLMCCYCLAQDLVLNEWIKEWMCGCQGDRVFNKCWWWRLPHKNYSGWVGVGWMYRV